MTSVYKTRQWAKDAVSRRLVWKKLTSGTGFPSGASQGREANSPSNTVILNGSRLNIFFKSAHIKVKHAEKRIMSQLFCIKKKKKNIRHITDNLNGGPSEVMRTDLEYFWYCIQRKKKKKKKKEKRDVFLRRIMRADNLNTFFTPQ